MRYVGEAYQCACKVDACCPCIWAVEPLRLGEAEKPMTTHLVDLGV